MIWHEASTKCSTTPTSAAREKQLFEVRTRRITIKDTRAKYPSSLLGANYRLNSLSLPERLPPCRKYAGSRRNAATATGCPNTELCARTLHRIHDLERHLGCR